MDDLAPVEKLRVLPADLATVGWEFVPIHRRSAQRLSGPAYQVVYERPFEPGVDARAPGHFLSVPISVQEQSQESWDAACWQAVETMRQIDARRKPE